MIRYSVVRNGDHRVAAVLVERRDLAAPRSDELIRVFSNAISLPIMLVALDESIWTGVRVYADFEAEPYLFSLLEERDVEWDELAMALDAETV